MAEHGTRTTYNAGCRCDDCAYAGHVYHARKRNRRVTPREVWERARHSPRTPVGAAARMAGSPVAQENFALGDVDHALTREQVYREPVSRRVNLRRGVGWVELVVHVDPARCSERDRAWLDDLVAALVGHHPR